MPSIPQDGTNKGPVAVSGSAPSVISLVVQGVEYKGWTRAAITYAANQAARSFAFTLVDNGEANAWNFRPSDEEALVLIDGETVLTGFIDLFAPSFSGVEHKIEISGRSKSADLIDSDADHVTGEFKGKTVGQIATALAPKGFIVRSDPGVPAIATFRLHPGETIHAAIDRASTKLGYLVMGTADGGILITRGSARVAHHALYEGRHIVTASGHFDNVNRHSVVKVRGQRAIGSHQKGSLQIEGAAPDHSMRRPRRRVHTANHDTTSAEAKRTAIWMQKRKFGESVKASIRLIGTRDDTGLLWQVNTRIYVHSPFLRMDQEMSILSVQITQDAAGTFTVLELVHPDALAGPEAAQPRIAHRTQRPRNAPATPPVPGGVGPDGVPNQTRHGIPMPTPDRTPQGIRVPASMPQGQPMRPQSNGNPWVGSGARASNPISDNTA